MADYYTNSADPADGSDLTSSVIRAENALIAAGFAKVAGYTGNGGKLVAVNSGGTAQEPIAKSTLPGSDNIGYQNIPQNSKSAAYTTVLGDAGKQIYHPGADTTARIWTIAANASVAYGVGTAITFINDTSAGVITIAINSDTLVWAGAGTTGSRSLAANGIATAVKMTSTRWLISGTGLS